MRAHASGRQDQLACIGTVRVLVSYPLFGGGSLSLHDKRVEQLRKLNIGTLRALLVLLREQSISRAAALVGVTQPAMSNALTRMRAVFGDPLITWVQTRMVLTPRAQELLAHLEVLVPDVEALIYSDSFDPAGATDTFRIGVTDHANFLIVPLLVSALREQAPGIRLVISTWGRQQFGEDANQTLDVRMGRMQQLPPTWFKCLLLNDDMVCIRARNPDNRAHSISMSELSALDHVAIAVQGGPENSVVESFFGKEGYERQVAAMVTNYGAIPHIVGHSDLVAVVPRGLARMFSAVVDIFEIQCATGRIEFSMSMAWPPWLNNHGAHRWLRGVAEKLARDLAHSKPG